MDATAQAYEKLVKNFIHWAEGEANVRGVVMIGSRARQDHPADEFADLDLTIFVADPAPYLREGGWAAAMGMPWLGFVEQTADGRSWERRVLYEGGLDVDFSFAPVAFVHEMIEKGVPPDLASLLSRGYRILLDKDGLAGQLHLESLSAPRWQPPTQAEFLEVVNDFWYHAVWTAKHLRRGELWWAKSGCDSHLKLLLRKMLEWHAHARGGAEKDTWLRGRFLEEWADPRAVQALRQAYAHYDAEDIWRALLATMELFRWLEQETGEKWGFARPLPGEQEASEFAQKLFTERGN